MNHRTVYPTHLAWEHRGWGFTMNALERLRRDHVILRAKLDVLENMLRMEGDAWFVLREVSFTLARQLRDHIKREEQLVVLGRQALNPKVLAEVALEHHDEPQHLRTIHRLFVSEPTHTLERIKPALLEVIMGLRRHMAEEEAELFPVLERVLAMHEEAAAVFPTPRASLDETMTVNRVVQRFPSTKPIFERLFINVPLEGCTCLDEVAWRHGMEACDLLSTLETAISSCQCATKEVPVSVAAGMN